MEEWNRRTSNKCGVLGAGGGRFLLLLLFSRLAVGDRVKVVWEVGPLAVAGRRCCSLGLASELMVACPEPLTHSFPDKVQARFALAAFLAFASSNAAFAAAFTR